MSPRLTLLLPALCSLAACMHAPANRPVGRTVQAAAPPVAPLTVCIGCGRIASLAPGELPRWRFMVKMDDGGEMLVFQEKTPALALGTPVRVVGGRLEPR
jgi:hypothetical protein